MAKRKSPTDWQGIAKVIMAIAALVAAFGPYFEQTLKIWRGGG